MIRVEARIDVDRERGIIRVGDFVYSIELLAEGIETPPRTVCKITRSKPLINGERTLLFTLQDDPR